ncbi:hypothetical protein [Methylobacterium oryzae]|uniref:hypothetical protein n=1 Tax=Methylobacterium oryzae TaxID=334852 RepID=UPI002F33D113
MTKKSQAQAFFDALIDNLAIDEEKAYGKGVPFECLPWGTLMIHYAGTSNKAHMKALKDLFEKVDGKKLTDEEAAQNEAELYANTIIVGILDPKGKPITYDDEAKAACAAALVKLPNVFSKVRVAANNEANFRVSRDKENAKNSARSSSSTKNGDRT